MAFNFDIKNTVVSQAVKREKLLLFNTTDFLSQLFLFLFILSWVSVLFSFFGSFSSYLAIKLVVLSLVLFFIFWNISLFKNLKIKKPELPFDISQAISNLNDYNLAEFLSFNSTKLARDAISFCKKRKIPVNSTSLFYFAVKASKDIAIISFRLGLDIKKLQDAYGNS